MLNASVRPSFSTATTTTVDRWTGEDRRNPFALRFLCVHQPFSSFSFFFFYEGRGVTQTKRVRDSISPLFFFFFLISHFRPPPTPSPWPLPSHSLPVDRRWGVRDRGRQRQYFTAAAQSSSAGTQYLQPTAMQQWQICLSLSVCECERERQRGEQREWERNKETKGGRESCDAQIGTNVQKFEVDRKDGDRKLKWVLVQSQTLLLLAESQQDGAATSDSQREKRAAHRFVPDTTFFLPTAVEILRIDPFPSHHITIGWTLIMNLFPFCCLFVFQNSHKMSILT